MSKQIAMNELAEVVTCLLTNPSLLDQFDELKTHKRFVEDIARVVGLHCGGKINSVTDDAGESLIVSVSPDDGITSIHQNVWSLHDKNGWADEDDDCFLMNEVEVGEEIPDAQIQCARNRIQYSLIVAADEVDHGYTPGNTLTIQFDADAATITQTIFALAPDLTTDMIVQGLSSGKYVTTLGHNKDERTYIIDNDSNKRIAFIVQQDVDGEYKDFHEFGSAQ